MATDTQTQVACDVKDISLADQGKRRMEWAFQSMPVLQTIRKQFIKTQPLAGIRVAACLHVTTETANLMVTLRDGGASIVLCVIVFIAFRALLGPAAMWGPFGGFVLGYIFYDTVHWYVHARHPSSGFGGWLRREHFLHHFRSPAGRFGVSCPWLDYVFATRGPRR